MLHVFAGVRAALQKAKIKDLPESCIGISKGYIHHTTGLKTGEGRYSRKSQGFVRGLIKKVPLNDAQMHLTSCIPSLAALNPGSIQEQHLLIFLLRSAGMDRQIDLQHHQHDDHQRNADTKKVQKGEEFISAQLFKELLKVYIFHNHRIFQFTCRPSKR